MVTTIDGLVTGIDTEAIIEGLQNIQQTQLDRNELKQSVVVQRKTAFSSLEAGLLSLRSAASGLSRTTNSVFSRNTATVSDDTKLVATAGESAAEGSYRLTVNSVARSHQLASVGFADSESEITTGTLEIRSGAGDLRTITIDSSNNTLGGLVEAINSSDAGVSASIIVDPSGGANSSRILLTSQDSGTANEISITNNLAASSGAATQVTFDIGNPVQAATDASITLGSGPGAIQVSSSTNQFDGVIEGVRLDILNATGGDEITLTVRRDTQAAVTGVQNLVDSFNSFIGQIDSLTKFSEGGNSGLLIGDRSVLSLQQRIRTTALESIPGLDQALNRLTAVGVSVTDAGLLTFNSSRLTSVLNGDVDGVGASDLKALFGTQAQSSTSGVRFVQASSRTAASQTPYEVDITQAAERAVATGSTAIAEPVVIDSSNRELTLSLNGEEGTVILAEGTYTATELAEQVELSINESSEFPGRNVLVGVSGGKLTITSEAYGSAAKVTVESGTALTALGFNGGETGVGQDVEGQFIVDGVVEVATGKGRVLTGDLDNENTADLKVEVTLDASQITSGVEAELTLTRGIASQLDKTIGEIVSSDSGLFSILETGFDSELESLRTAFDRQQSLFDAQREDLIAQFVALESAVSQLQSTGSFLTAQLGSISSFGS